MFRTLIWNNSITVQTLPAAYDSTELMAGYGYVVDADVPSVISALGGFSAMNGKFVVFAISSDEALGVRLVSVRATGGTGEEGTGGPIFATDVIGLAPVAISGSYASLIGKPALKPAATTGSYNDLIDKPSIPVASNDAPAATGTSYAGASPDFARKDHVHAHGSLEGGSFHAPVSAAAAGFMAATDKVKLDALAPATTAPPAIAEAGAKGVGAEYALTDHTHAHGDQTGVTLHAAATPGASGFMSGVDKQRFDGVIPGTTVPVAIAAAGAAGSASSYSSSDHTHAHGDQAGGTAHAAATTTAAGFMSATDKSKLDGLATVASSGAYSDLTGKPSAPYDIGSFKQGSLTVGQTIGKYKLPRSITVSSFEQGPAAGAGGAVSQMQVDAVPVSAFPVTLSAGVLISVVVTTAGVDNYWTIKAVEA